MRFPSVLVFLSSTGIHGQSSWNFTPNGLNPLCAKDLGTVEECFGRDFGGLGEGFGTFWEDFERSGHFGRSWGYFGVLFWVFCMCFKHFMQFCMFWTSQAARWRVRTVRGLQNNHLADVATFGAFFSSFFLASIF